MCSPGNRMVHTNGFISEGQYRNLRGGIVIIHTLSLRHTLAAVFPLWLTGENTGKMKKMRHWHGAGKTPGMHPASSLSTPVPCSICRVH